LRTPSARALPLLQCPLHVSQIPEDAEGDIATSVAATVSYLRILKLLKRWSAFVVVVELVEKPLLKPSSEG
jgi:hypothetical protein